MTQSVGQQLNNRDHFFPDPGADLKPLGVGVNQQSGYVGHDFALEHVEVGIDAVQHRSPIRTQPPAYSIRFRHRARSSIPDTAPAGRIRCSAPARGWDRLAEMVGGLIGRPLSTGGET